jgi:hypothetical protein
MDSQHSNAAGGAQLTRDEVMSTLRSALEQADTTFVPYEHHLTEKHRKHLMHSGLKNHGFAVETARIVTENPALVPGYIGVEKMAADYTDYKNRRELCAKVHKLALAMDDGLLAAGDTYLHDVLAVYQYIKEGAQRGDPACEVAYSVLKPRFEDQGRKNNDEGTNTP